LDALKEEGLGLSVVSLAELYEGVYYSTDPGRSERGLTDFLRAVSLIGVDVDTCRLFGRERGRLRRQKRPIADFDLLIGATALQHDLTLLTNNRRHFEFVEGLRLESQPQ
jgi:tRNA(fMet)-specific endonuclease VapC